MEEGRGVLPQTFKGERQEVRTRERHYVRVVESSRERRFKCRAKYKKTVAEGLRRYLKVSVNVTELCDSPLKLVHLHGGLEVLWSH